MEKNRSFKFNPILQDLNGSARRGNISGIVTLTPKKTLFFLNKELRRTHACHKLIVRVLRFVYPSNFNVTNEVTESILGNTLIEQMQRCLSPDKGRYAGLECCQAGKHTNFDHCQQYHRNMG